MERDQVCAVMKLSLLQGITFDSANSSSIKRKMRIINNGDSRLDGEDKRELSEKVAFEFKLKVHCSY